MGLEESQAKPSCFKPCSSCPRAVLSAVLGRCKEGTTQKADARGDGPWELLPHGEEEQEVASEGAARWG